MHAHLAVSSELADALAAAGVAAADPGAPTVLTAPRHRDDWTATLEGLTEVYRLARAAAIQGSPIVFLVSTDALLGRTGALDAMAASGVVSASRTLALELRKQEAVSNCIAVVDGTPADEAARWIVRLLEASPDGPTGELIHLGGAQIGKALS